MVSLLSQSSILQYSIQCESIYNNLYPDAGIFKKYYWPTNGQGSRDAITSKNKLNTFPSESFENTEGVMFDTLYTICFVEFSWFLVKWCQHFVALARLLSHSDYYNVNDNLCSHTHFTLPIKIIKPTNMVEVGPGIYFVVICDAKTTKGEHHLPGTH